MIQSHLIKKLYTKFHLYFLNNWVILINVFLVFTLQSVSSISGANNSSISTDAGELSTITLDESTIFIPSTNGTSETNSISASTETSIQVTTTTLEKVDCILGEWADWSNCSKSCGGGNRSRSRPVETQEANGGNPCKEEDKSESEECNSQDCPIDCQWGPFGEWTTCTKSCGGGEKTRSRSKETSAENGGKECLGNGTDNFMQ